jgi:phospholipase/carboxylesterase
VGFSNGANMANSLLMLHPELVAGSVAIAAMRLFTETPQVPVAPRHALIVNGDADELVTAEMTDGLVTQLGKIGADVRLIGHPGGHEVPDMELDAVAAYIASLG